MRPKPFKPVVHNNNENYVRDTVGELVWYRCMNRPLYADTDSSKLVYHANYLRYFELGRASLMRDASYPYKEIEENGYIYPIIELGINYYKSLFYDDPMWIHTRPGELGRVRLQFDYVITHAETNDIVCKGFTRHCALNESRTPVAIDPMTLHLWDTFPK